MLDVRDLLTELRDGDPPPLLRPARRPRQPAGGEPNEPGRGDRIRGLGHRVRQGARRGGRGRARCWARRESVAAAINEYGVQRGLPAVGAAAGRGSGPPSTPPRRSTAPSWSRSPCRRRRCAATSPSGPPALAPGLHAGLPDEGHRAGHHQADEPGHRARPPGSTRIRVVVVSGPNLAAGDRRRAAGRDRGGRASTWTGPRRVQQAITTPYLRPYTNDDVVGCELGGAVKNVIALAYGMATAMGFGDNTKASLITRGLAETARLGVALGADPMTFAGLAGLGDLVATCSSPLSRNRTFGEHLGRGETLEQAQASTRQTAEGVKSCLAIRDLARGARGGDADHRAGRAGLPRGRGPAGGVKAADEPGDEARSDERHRTSDDAYGDGTRAVHAGLPRAGGGRAVPARAGVRRAVPPRPGRPGRPDQRVRAAGQPDPAPPGGGDRRARGRRTCSPSPAGRRPSPALLLAVLRPGDTVVLPSDGYYTVRAFAEATLRELGVTVDHGADGRAVPVVRRRPAGAAGDAGQPGPGRLRHRGAVARPRTPPARWSRSTTPPRRRSGSARWTSAPT